MTTKKTDSWEKRFEERVEKGAENFQAKAINWLRTSQFFDGMVNTPARIFINTMSFLALYVWGFWVFATEGNIIAWVCVLLLLLFMQAASVRFVFNTEGVADELQIQKKNNAYRKAYNALRVRLVLISLLIAVLAIWGNLRDEIWYLVTFSRTGVFYLDNYRAIFIAVFLIALVSFQKYFSYGMKGEPFTVRENSKIKD